MGPTASRLLLALAIAGQPLAASAQVWAMFHADGERPNRSIYLAYLTYIGSRVDPHDVLAAVQQVQRERRAKPMSREEESARVEALSAAPELRIVQILESANGPYAREMSLVFRCANHTVTVLSHQQYLRRDALIEPGPTGGPRPVQSEWVQRAQRVACEQAAWRQALEADRKKRPEEPAQMARLDMGVLGTFSHPYQIDTLLWAHAWKDGTRPVFVDNRSPEEIERIRRHNQEQARIAGAMIDGLTSALEGKIKAEDDERAFVDRVHATFAGKSPTQRRLMSPQAAWSEKDVLDFWGPPNQVIDQAGGARVFVYRKERDERVTTQIIDTRSGQVAATSTAGQLRQCELSLTLRPGGRVPGPRLVDFTMGGENCNVDTLGKNRPR